VGAGDRRLELQVELAIESGGGAGSTQVTQAWE
jgi:hypothetical protein